MKQKKITTQQLSTNAQNYFDAMPLNVSSSKLHVCSHLQHTVHIIVISLGPEAS